MDLSIPGSTNAPLSTAAVFADNVQDLLGTGTLLAFPTGIITVNSIDDTVNSSPGVTTLRDAILQANADQGEDLIVFDRSLFSTAQTITLKLGELDITHSLDIIAPRDTLTGSDLVTVSGNKASRVFEIEAGATVNLSGLIVADGKVTNYSAGGIQNSGTLTLESSIVRNSSSTSSNSNGIYSSGNLTVENSSINNNSGNGIYSSGNLTVNNSTISGNLAGGMYNSGTSTVSNSTISRNQTLVTGNGGGIYTTGTLILESSIVSGNQSIAGAGEAGAFGGSGGGIYNGKSGITTINNSQIINNSVGPYNSSYGGGIYSSGRLTVTNSIISRNSATFNGGGIYNDTGSVTVNNSTISGNSARQNGGGIYNDYIGTVTLLFSTVTQNIAANGGGVYQNDVPLTSTSVRGSFNVRNTIIAANVNTQKGVNSDVSGTFNSLGYNLIGDSTGSTGFDETIGDIVGTSDWVIDPRLASLDFNGGPTQTIALLPDSPAIGAADPIVLDTDPITDQRGLPRRAADGSADIGAYELS